MLKLYLLTRIGVTDYDEHAGFVIAAHSAREARTLAGKAAHTYASHNRNVWRDPLTAELKILTDRTRWPEPGVVLEDFRAG